MPFSFHQYWEPRGHVFGTCMSKPNLDLMYVNIPKNASSWTKNNLLDQHWEFYNYHQDQFHHKHVMVVLRNPVERWLSGICEYFTIYHRDIDTSQFTQAFYDLLIEQITFDDHTEKQVYFIEGLDPSKTTFFWCDKDYRLHFSQFLRNQGIPGAARYANYDFQHTTEDRLDGDTRRSIFKTIFKHLVDNPVYLEKIKQHYAPDYKLISKVKFWRG
jgi:hypothetical protein